MKLRQYIKYLRKIEKNNPDLLVLYSIDEEGNDYKEVNHSPTLCFQDKDKNIFFENSSGYKTPNAIIIN